MQVKTLARNTLLAPFWTAAIFTGAKSFRANPVLASPRLNRAGLHRRRVAWASATTAYRRRHLGHLVSDDHARQLDQDGYVVLRDVLPTDQFDRLSHEVENTPFPANENRQGETVNRFCGIPPAMLADLPTLKTLLEGPLYRGLLQYAASFRHDPMFNLNTVMTEPGTGRRDPNTMYHSDTFHSVGKGWFFLRDVQMADGPFSFVPGSHRLTPQRLEWEHEMSVGVGETANPLNAIGSFRASLSDIRAMGYPDPVAFDVPANSLVVADTNGFHARCLSTRPSVRLAIYGSLRANPFMPFTGLDLFSLPGLKGRKTDVINGVRYAAARLSGRALDQPSVGAVRPGDPPLT